MKLADGCASLTSRENDGDLVDSGIYHSQWQVDKKLMSNPGDKQCFDHSKCKNIPKFLSSGLKLQLSGSGWSYSPDISG